MAPVGEAQGRPVHTDAFVQFAIAHAFSQDAFPAEWRPLMFVAYTWVICEFDNVGRHMPVFDELGDFVIAAFLLPPPPCVVLPSPDPDEVDYPVVFV